MVAKQPGSGKGQKSLGVRSIVTRESASSESPIDLTSTAGVARVVRHRLGASVSVDVPLLEP